ncbi:MAG: poly-gamma-glutamate system protein [Candidatus Cloacimonetes bacterium]|nr:poly-gamma-glutamate system protein [Candidatus Cloacimonadota bacterium]
MYRPSLKSNKTLIALLILSVGLFFIAQRSYVHIKADYYEEKVEAATEMQQFLEVISQELTAGGYEFDLLDDPLRTGLIGTRLSSITTSRGVLSEKQTALNPNLAAVMVQELVKLNLQAGDHIAVGITGSNPGANLALYAAVKVLKLEPSIIVALSSSSYGANREDLTWLDIEAILYRRGLIGFKSDYASLGGRDDMAIGLSDSGVQALRDAMLRHNTPLLLASSLDENVDLRISAYNEQLPEDMRYRAFVNIGGALANVGSNVNARLIPEGINRRLGEKEFETKGVMMLMAKKNVPVIHVLRILRWASNNDMPVSPDSPVGVGQGRIFSYERHNTFVAAICLVILLMALVAVIIFDRYDRHFMANIVDPDEEL